jgi:formylglycine-generating enzyme required for sulfatase activity
MSEPSLTINFPSPNSDKRFHVNATEIKQIASLILRKSNPHCFGWTKDNLNRRLSKLLPQRICILVLFIIRSEKSGMLNVYFDSGSEMPLVELLHDVCGSDFCPTFMFFVLGHDVDESNFLKVLSLTDAQFAAWVSVAHYREMLALGCEFSRWWNLRSLKMDDVKCNYLAERLSVLINKLNLASHHKPLFSFKDCMQRNVVAWSGGDIVITSVDYDKFLTGARVEQFSDALKRLADAAASPRALHQRPADHLISTQAILWFTELPAGQIDFDWVSYTRFAFELFGRAVADRALQINLQEQDKISKEAAQAFLDDFVVIPAGTYWIGTTESATFSEPPAQRFEIYLATYRIFKRPITGTDWLLFCDTQLSSMSNEYPVRCCNAFHAMLFASIVQRKLRDLGLITLNSSVVLPTERQWEVAARGNAAFDYPWGDSFQSTRCNCDLLYGPRATIPGMFSPQGDSPFGCQDMSGNVREWTRSYGGIADIDWRSHNQPEVIQPLDSLQPSDRLIVRGGSYSYDADCVRTWVRNTQVAERSDQQTGFRLVIEGDYA